MDRQCHKSSSIGLMVSQFSKDYVKKYNEDSDEGYFFPSWFSKCWKITWTPYWFSHFAWK